MKIDGPTLTRYTRRQNAVQYGAMIEAPGMGAAYSLAPGPAVSGLGVALAVFHAARGAAFAAQALHAGEKPRLEQRLGTAAGESLVAAGHLVGALGGGWWSVPLLAGGTVLNSVVDYRYREHYEPATPPSGPTRLTPGQKALDVADLASPLLGPAGFALGAGHLGLAGWNYLHGTHETTHSRHCSGFGNALLAAGEIAGACGAGAAALPAVVGGLVITNLQNARDGGSTL